MEEQIPLLIELSQADFKTHRLRERYQLIPKEIEKHESGLRAHSVALAESEQRLEDIRREQRALERESDMAKARRRELELQQFRVKNTIEYQAMTKEIEEMRRRSSDFDDQSIALLEQEDEIRKEVERLQDLVGQEQERLGDIRNRLEEERRGLDEGLQAAERAREALAGRLSPRVRTRYERILKNKGDMAVVSIASGACGGCFYQLPPQRLAEVRKGAALILCEGCGRILVWSED